MFLHKAVIAAIIFGTHSVVNGQDDGGRDPSLDSDLRAGRTLIDTWEENGANVTVWGYGSLVQKAIPLDNGSTTTVQEWSNGTTVQVSGYLLDEPDHPDAGRMLRRDEAELHARVCKRTCKREVTYWSTDVQSGQWWTAWKRTNAIAYNGGTVSYCDSIITSPAVSVSFGLNLGILSGALGFAPGATTSNGRCYGCVARTTGDKCSRLWYQEKMNWKDGNLWKRDTQYDNGANACSICGNEWDTTSNLGRTHVDWAATENGFPIIVPGCSPCSD